MAVSIDQRTRRHDEVRDLNAEEVWGPYTERAMLENGALAARGKRYLGLPPLTVVAGAITRTLRAAGSTMVVEDSAESSADQPLVASMEPEDLSRLVQDRASPMGLAMDAKLVMERGELDTLIGWEPVLRALYDGRPVHERGDVTFEDRGGAPLALDRSFRADDDPAEISHFLGQAGFLHVEGIFTEAEMAAVAHDLDAAVGRAEPDDGESWWATTKDGAHQAVRILNFHERSETLRELLNDDRYAWLATLTNNRHHGRGRGAEGLTKPVGVVDGISDLPWHKDCAQGMHSYMCSNMTVGISITGAAANSGALAVVPGSHRANVRTNFLGDDLDLEPLVLETATGDVTVHCTCTLHMSKRPKEVERKVVYSGFTMPLLPGDVAVTISDEERRARRAALDRSTDRIDAADRHRATTRA